MTILLLRKIHTGREKIYLAKDQALDNQWKLSQYSMDLEVMVLLFRLEDYKLIHFNFQLTNLIKEFSIKAINPLLYYLLLVNLLLPRPHQLCPILGSLRK